MTIEQLLSMSADKLEAMSDSELEAYFQPFFSVTRPAVVQHKPVTTAKNKRVALAEQARAIAAQYGIPFPE